MRKKINLFFNGLLLSLFFAATVGTAYGSIFTVTKTADTNDGVCDSDCSLREAAEAASSFISDNIILFAPGLNGSTITVAAPRLQLFGAKSIRIEGPGADLLTISGGNSTGIFKVTGKEPMNLRFAGMTLTGGKGGQSDIGGGAISSISLANIEIDRVHFAGNSMPVPGQGGAVLLAGGGNNRISNSTFSGNSAFSCGAVSVLGSSITIVNTTFSGNSAAANGEGGAICVGVAGTAAVFKNVTVTGNTARDGGAVAVSNGSVNIGNSVIAGNIATNFPEMRRGTNGTIISDGNNHIGDSAGDSTNTEFPITWAGSDVLNTPPALGALQNNGGRMPTIAPAKGSPLINTGSNVLSGQLFIDQRGFSRITGGTVDKGAVESSSTQATVTVSGRVTSQTGRAIPNTLVTLTDMVGNKRSMFASTAGYYSFTVPSNESYFVTALRRRYTFPSVLLSAEADVFTQLMNTP